ncbi:MAG: hypothetical protein KDA63_09585 [Planctomycetales bacterium]|nr:hypothetical protein [Planctomycetales bacterium]
MGPEQHSADGLKRSVRQAQRRLGIQRLLGVLPWTLSATLLVAAVLVGVEARYGTLGLSLAGSLGVAAGVGLLLAAVWAVLRRPAPLDAASEIDRRFGLKERVSSWQCLSDDDLATSAGTALRADAERRVKKLNVGDEFKVKLTRWSLLPLAPALLAFCLATFVNPAGDDNAAQAHTENQQEKQHVKKGANVLKKKLADRKKRAEELGLDDATDMINKLERGAEEMSKSENSKKDALVKLNELSSELNKRRGELAEADELKKELKKLGDLSKGPADKLADAIKQGNFEMMAEEIKQLQQDIEAGNLSKEDIEKLAQQLNQIKDNIDELAKARKETMEQLQKQIEQMKQAGNKDEADKLQKQLDKLTEQQKQMQKMQAMAEKLGECANCMKIGQMDKAMQSLQDMQANMESLQQMLDGLELMDEMLADLSECKGMCNGKSDQRSNKTSWNDWAQGEGRGAGKRDLEEDDTSSYKSKARTKVGQGAAIVRGLASGPNAKGEVTEQIRSEFATGVQTESDPLADQPLPKRFREHVGEYQDALREGR